MTIDPKCCEELSVSRVKVEQFGKKAVFINDDRMWYKKITVDGCVITNELCSDYIISCQGLGDLIVELKGKDVEHAVKQVEATAQHWSEKGYRTGELAALIVSTQHPKINTEVRKAQERFAKKYKRPLHVVTKNFEGHLEAVFSFRGPHKT